MQTGLRSLLYRDIDFFVDTRYAARKAGRGTLYSPDT